jgi:hypothetical protein
MSGGQQIVLTDPDLITNDLSFMSSAKGYEIFVNISASFPVEHGGCVANGGQITVDPNVRGSFQGSRGICAVHGEQEGTGGLGVLAMYHPQAQGAGAWGILRGSQAGFQTAAVRATSEVADGVNPEYGVQVNSSSGNNRFRQGISVEGCMNWNVRAIGLNDTNAALWTGWKANGTLSSCIRADGSVEGSGFNKISDASAKVGIVDYNPAHALEAVMSLRLRSFWHKLYKRDEVGLVAQEVDQTSLAGLVRDGDWLNKYMSIDQLSLIPYLIGSVQHIRKQQQRERLVLALFAAGLFAFWAL